MTDAVTYGNLQLRLGETLLSVYQLDIIEEPGKHGRMYADAQAQEGEKDYLLYEEYRWMWRCMQTGGVSGIHLSGDCCQNGG